MKVFLAPALKQYFNAEEDLFEQLMQLKGKTFRAQPGRLTQKVQLGAQTYFIKQHTGVGWLEILKNLSQLRFPILGAKNEWEAINKLQALGVLVPAAAGYGQEGVNPATQRSFILLEDVQPVKTLEDLAIQWQSQPPPFALKLKLIKEVAGIAATLHNNGMNHRDFYLCHFLITNTNALCLIDLHRAQIRKKTPERWVIKDLAGLYFSSKDCGLTKRDHLRFMRYYRNASLRDMLPKEINFWKSVAMRGEQLYRDHAK